MTTRDFTVPAAESVVQQQLDAYNQRDLESYLVLFSEDIKIYRPPDQEPTLSGKQALAEFYANERFNRINLHAELINRMVIGNTVIDHEQITGVTTQPMEMAAVYAVDDGLITRIWFYQKA